MLFGKTQRKTCRGLNEHAHSSRIAAFFIATYIIQSHKYRVNNEHGLLMTENVYFSLNFYDH